MNSPKMNGALIDIILPLYNGEKEISKTLASIYSQEHFDQLVNNVFVIDDCSTDSSARIVQKIANGKTQLIRTPKNIGRSKTINRGIESSTATIILILDSDCSLSNPQSLSIITNAWNNGYQVCFGCISAEGGEFWDQYQREVAFKRFHSKSIIKQTTAIFSCARALLDQSGYFPEEYSHYGFEDRDLLARLVRIVTPNMVLFSNQLIAIHRYELRLPEIASKMYLAGKHTSGIFLNKYPDVYSQQPYSRIDVRLGVNYSMILKCAGHYWKPVSSIIESQLHKKWIPFKIRSQLVKVAMALAFCEGTKDAVPFVGTCNSVE